MSTATAPTSSAEPSSGLPATARARGAILVGAALAVAALSLALPWALAFDPAMWLVWGRDITRLTLDTRAGPSWKPGPVLLTAPFSLFGGAAAALWLIVARAGALLALAGAWSLGRRLAGTRLAAPRHGATPRRVAPAWGGAAAAAAMALSPWWLPNAALGNSEGILAAAVLWAVVAHVTGHRRAAVLLGLVAALLRPEVWPFLIVYGLWAWRADPRARPVLVLAAIAVPVLWFGPDVTGAGGALGASDAARGTPSKGSAGLAAHPVLTLLWDAVKIGGIPAFAAAVVAAALAARGASARQARPPAPRRGLVAALRAPLVAALWAGVVGWVAIVAVMTAAGYAGNPRYLVVAAALLAVLAGAGAAWLVAAVRLPGAVALVLPLAVGALAFGGLRDAMRDVGVRADRREALPRVVDAAGGRDALVRCAPIRTGDVVRGLVAWELDVPAYGINARPARPAAVLQVRPYDGGAPDPAFASAGFRRAAAVRGWTVWEACRG